MNTAIKNIWEHYLYTVIMIMAVLFMVGWRYIPSVEYLVLLNGLFCGATISLGFTYGRFLWHTITTHEPYTPERQWIISCAVLWAAYIIIVMFSIRVTATGVKRVDIGFDLLLSRYFAIVAAVMQIFTPDMGKSLFYNVDRRVMWAGLAAGLLLSVAVIWLQMENDNMTFLLPFNLG